MTEDQLEREELSWLQEAGDTHLYGPDIAPEGSKPMRLVKPGLLDYHRWGAPSDSFTLGFFVGDSRCISHASERNSR